MNLLYIVLFSSAKEGFFGGESKKTFELIIEKRAAALKENILERFSFWVWIFWIKSKKRKGRRISLWRDLGIAERVAFVIF